MSKKKCNFLPSAIIELKIEVCYYLGVKQDLKSLKTKSLVYKSIWIKEVFTCITLPKFHVNYLEFHAYLMH